MNKVKTYLKKLVRNDRNLKFQKVSYSQCGEDLIVEFIFNQLGIYKPTYLDIGAHDPFYLSNTAIFYKKGCRGINVEPDLNLYNKIIKHRQQDINLNIGIAESTGYAEFYVMNVPTLNTFSVDQVELYKKEGDYFVTEIKKIKLDTVKNVIDYNNGIFPDFLSLDAEGIDETVIKSINYSNKPKVICVETLSFSNSGNGRKNNDIIVFLNDNGYFLYADTHINSIFIDRSIWEKQGI
ncbi:FkbM family methyltransferase [Pedobacter sp. N23S346]|uniref:FkbM family methyltransferase n=1 Tax=Pedobacter sp. N23S346 TaxID=3402750 RepID=UPI003AC72FBB